MANTWVLVAHRAGARIFENQGPGQGLRLLENIPNPEGRLRDSEINSDKPGRAFDKFGSARHSMSKEHLPSEQLAMHFAKQLGDRLDKGRSQNQFDRLVLVAEPRFLGELRAALPVHTATLVSATVDRDLGGISDRDVPGHLGEAVRL